MINRRTGTSLTILAIAAFWALLAAAGAGAAPLYFDNFDSDTAGACPAGWSCGGGTGSVASATVAFSGAQSLALNRGATTTNVFATTTALGSVSERVTFQFWWNIKYTQANASSISEVDLMSST